MTKLTMFDNENVEVIEKKRVFDGFFKVDKYAFRHSLFNGGQSEVIYREIFERGNAVAVLPYDPATDTVLLIEQIRIGALKTKQSPWLLEVIAGMADGSEEYEAVAKKEAFEESNIQLDKLEFMLSYLSSPGGTSERLYLYFAYADLSQAGGIHGLESEGEDIKVHVLPVSKAFELLEQGELDNSATLISMQWLKLNIERIRREYKVGQR